MKCRHTEIKSVNCVLYCAICGERLPDNWRPAGDDKNRPTEPKMKKAGKKDK